MEGQEKEVNEVEHPPPSSSAMVPGTYHIPQLDVLKAVGIFWIVLNHCVERLLGSPYIANPSAHWPPIGERLAQLKPLDGSGLWGMALNLLRYVGWAGDQGVQLFIIASGFGLTWGLLNRRGLTRLDVPRFYRERLVRIYPMWWLAHFGVLVAFFLFGRGLLFKDLNFYLSLAGLRMTKELFYYLSPAWWFIGLLLQFYLLYPLLWNVLRKRGPTFLFVVASVSAFVVRAIGLFWFSDYLDPWSRGAIFVSRLPEFVFGVCLAGWIFSRDETFLARLGAPRTVLLAVTAYIAGTGLSLTLWGMIFSPFLLGSSLFVLLFAFFRKIKCLGRVRRNPIAWVGRHSFSVYLVHHPILFFTLSPLVFPETAPQGSLFLPLLTMCTCIVLSAWGLEFLTRLSVAAGRRWMNDGGWRQVLVRVLTVGLAVGCCVLGTESMIRWLNPQEVLGWGERPSLQEDESLGWRLKPSTRTRLRWESYDYVVETNSLGFPGPEYPVEKPEQTVRILTVGDAFTSAEGVDTAEAWPRVLEREWNRKEGEKHIQVLNFGVTGYGPRQYAEISKTYVPVYHPDLVVIGFFVNEYRDAVRDKDDMVREIGFHLPPQGGLRSIVKLEHLRRFLRVQVKDPIRALSGRPEWTHPYMLGNFRSLERRGNGGGQEGYSKTRDYLRVIKDVTVCSGTPVVVMMIPAPGQVCDPEDLAYYPSHVDLSDASVFDIDLPQRMTREIAESFGFHYIDLREAFEQEGAECPYQPRNMHWTARGHRRVATYLTEKLGSEYFPRGPEPG